MSNPGELRRAPSPRPLRSTSSERQAQRRRVATIARIRRSAYETRATAAWCRYFGVFVLLLTAQTPRAGHGCVLALRSGSHPGEIRQAADAGAGAVGAGRGR